jgi:hypothetical protein
MPFIQIYSYLFLPFKYPNMTLELKVHPLKTFHCMSLLWEQIFSNQIYLLFHLNRPIFLLCIVHLNKKNWKVEIKHITSNEICTWEDSVSFITIILCEIGSFQCINHLLNIVWVLIFLWLKFLSSCAVAALQVINSGVVHGIRRSVITVKFFTA